MGRKLQTAPGASLQAVKSDHWLAGRTSCFGVALRESIGLASCFLFAASVFLLEGATEGGGQHGRVAQNGLGRFCEWQGERRTQASSGPTSSFFRKCK